MKKPKYSYTLEELQLAVSNARSYAQALKNLGLNASGSAYTFIQKNIREHNIPTEHFLGQGWSKGQPGPKHQEIPVNEIIVLGLHPYYATSKLRIRLIRDGFFERKCYACNGTEWMGSSIPLELEHINGIKTDHRLENLTILCPNCHAQTSTHAGKNKRGSVRRTRTDTPCGTDF